MISLTGGPRAFAREGFRIEEETNWRRAELLVAAGLAANRRHRVPPRTAEPGEQPDVQPRRHPLPHQPGRSGESFLAGNETSGRLQMPLLTLHTTGDGQVPIDQARHPPAPGGRRRSRPAARAAGVPRPGPLRVHEHRVGGGPRGARPVGRARGAPAGNDLLRRAPERAPPAVRAEPAARHAGGRCGPRRSASRRAARTAHARRAAVRRPLARRGGPAAERARHTLPAGAVLGPRRPLPDHGDGRRGRRAAAACAVRGSPCGRSRTTASSTASGRGRGRAAARSPSRRLVLAASIPTGPCRRGREFAGEAFTPRRAASSRAGPASSPTSAARAAG